MAMIASIFLASAVCLSVALLGWERSPPRVGCGYYGIDASYAFSYPDDEVYGCCEVEGCDCGNLFMPCPMCPWSVDLTHVWPLTRAVYRATWMLRAIKRDFDHGRVSNSTWFGLMAVTNGAIILFGYRFKWGKQFRSVGCQKESEMWRKLEQWQTKHRGELEQMAKTIEFMQRKYRRQHDLLEHKGMTVDFLGTGIRRLYRTNQELKKGREKMKYGFQFPELDFEWDE